MTTRTRYLWLTILAAIAGFLAFGAWSSSPDHDNQGGILLALLLFLVLLFIYVPVTVRAIGAKLRRRHDPEAISREDAK